MLVLPATLELSPSVDHALGLMGEDKRFRRGRRESQLELVTPVSGNAVAAALHLAEARLELAERLEGEFAIAAAGTHPFATSWGGISEDERSSLTAQESASAERNTSCGFGVHVAVPGAERALAVYNAARSFLPEVCALATNSPFVEGLDTGLASVMGRPPIAPHRSGVPPAFASWEEFVDLVEWRRRGRVSPEPDGRWWDLCIDPRLGTLEFHSADVQTRVEDAAAVAALCQCLVAWLGGRLDEGAVLQVHDSARIAENAWRAARYGTRGSLVDLDTGAPEETRDRIARLLESLEPTAERLGLTWPLLTARALLADNGAERQRYVHARHGATGLARWLTEETASSASEYLTQRR